MKPDMVGLISGESATRGVDIGPDVPREQVSLQITLRPIGNGRLRAHIHAAGRSSPTVDPVAHHKISDSLNLEPFTWSSDTFNQSVRASTPRILKMEYKDEKGDDNVGGRNG